MNTKNKKIDLKLKISNHEKLIEKNENNINELNCELEDKNH